MDHEHGLTASSHALLTKKAANLIELLKQEKELASQAIKKVKEIERSTHEDVVTKIERQLRERAGPVEEAANRNYFLQL